MAGLDRRRAITDHKFEPCPQPSCLGKHCAGLVKVDGGYDMCYEPESAHADTQEPDQKRGE